MTSEEYEAQRLDIRQRGAELDRRQAAVDRDYAGTPEQVRPTPEQARVTLAIRDGYRKLNADLVDLRRRALAAMISPTDSVN